MNEDDICLGKVLCVLYQHEINIEISSFWDEGYTVKIGDPINGYKDEETMLDSPKEIARWLHDTADRLFDIDWDVCTSESLETM